MRGIPVIKRVLQFLFSTCNYYLSYLQWAYEYAAFVTTQINFEQKYDSQMQKMAWAIFVAVIMSVI